MANRKATFAKRQREADLKDRAKQKEDRRTQKRTEVRDSKGPQIAWDEAVHAVTSDELPPLGQAEQDQDDDGDGADADDAPDVDDAPTPPASSVTQVNASPGAAPKPMSAAPKAGPVGVKPTASSGPASPRGVG
jgi:hypothetical protein